MVFAKAFGGLRTYTLSPFGRMSLLWDGAVPLVSVDHLAILIENIVSMPKMRNTGRKDRFKNDAFSGIWHVRLLTQCAKVCSLRAFLRSSS